MSIDLSPSTSSNAEELGKSTPGRGYVVIIYGLYIGSIMAVITAPIGAAIAHLRIGRSAPWLDTHLLFQLRTFWLGLFAMGISLLLWWAANVMGLAPIYAWSFGYLFFTAGIAWMMGRCGVGVHRLMANRPIDSPKSWLFGLGHST